MEPEYFILVPPAAIFGLILGVGVSLRDAKLKLIGGIGGATTIAASIFFAIRLWS